MPKPYVLKNSPIDKNRIAKIVKTFLENVEEDRENALKTFNYFKDKVDNNDDDSQSKAAMVDCLKASSTAQNNGIKLLSLLVAMEGKISKGKSNSGTGFSELDDEDED